MYVCICQAVTDRQIRQAAQDGARTLGDLRRALGVSSECGQCAAAARQCLDDANQSLRAAAKPAPKHGGAPAPHGKC